MDSSPHKSGFISSNGVNLHYLDWQGDGDALIFLTGMGCSAHLFDHIAPRFTDRFRVLALTRRGQGESDAPETGYGLDTLVGDICGLMDARNVERANFAGHSLAGVELLYLAEKYPQRVDSLIFLDAVYDGKGRQDVFERDPLEQVENIHRISEFLSVAEYAEYVKRIRPDLAQIWNETWDQVMAFELSKDATSGMFVEKDTSAIAKQVLAAALGYDPQNANVKVPVLSLVALSEIWFPDYLTEQQRQSLMEYVHTQWRPFQQREIALLKKNIPQAKVVELPNSHHYCFMWQEDRVYEEMRKFLLE